MSKILNFGSINIDHVYKVDHFIRAGETSAGLQYDTFPGGKGLNQSVALALAGSEVYHAGKVGPDGLHLLQLLQKSGVNTEFVSPEGSVTGHAIIQVDINGQNCILLHKGANNEITETEIEATLSHFGPEDILVLQNEINHIPLIMQKAREKGLRIAFNPSPFDGSVKNYPFEYVTWLLLNEIEGEELTGSANPEIIAKTLLSRYPGMKIVLTLGRRGVLYQDRTERFTHGIYDVPVVDTTAAGDTFTGFFLTAAAQGLPINECLRLASIASSIAVAEKGAAVSIPTMTSVKNSNLVLDEG